MSNNSSYKNFAQIFNNKEFKEASNSILYFSEKMVSAFNSSNSLIERISVLSKLMMNMSNSAKLAVIGITAFAGAIEQHMAFARAGEQIVGLITTSGMAADKFQTLANAVKHYGGTADGVANTMFHLRKNLQDVQSGGNGNGLLEFLSQDGINISGIKSVDQLLPIIAIL